MTPAALANGEGRKAQDEPRKTNRASSISMPIQYNDPDQESAADSLAASPNI
jgi:hypothetical protein